MLNHIKVTIFASETIHPKKAASIRRRGPLSPWERGFLADVALIGVFSAVSLGDWATQWLMNRGVWNYPSKKEQVMMNSMIMVDGFLFTQP